VPLKPVLYSGDFAFNVFLLATRAGGMVKAKYNLTNRL
jgi:hypothetical protein